jgi:short-chain Z-isoprenyl diphosphate synthase
MLRGYGPVGWPAPGTSCDLAGGKEIVWHGYRPAPTAGPRVTGVGVRSRVRDAIVQVYERRLARALEGADIPRHVGVIMDGNRRWARAIGLEDVAHGHRRGADKIVDLLGWCDDAGVSVVTLFMLSTDNLSRPEPEVRALLQIIEDVAVDLARPGRRWQVRAMGAPEVLPSETVAVLKQAEEDTCDRPGATVNLAVGYGGRQEIADAVRSLLAEHAERGTTLEELVEALEVEHIAAHLYTRGQPDPDLVIRTSGEQRLSGFLLWQTANTEFHFTDVYWPDFRRVDFLRALRDYSARHRRFGS